MTLSETPGPKIDKPKPKKSGFFRFLSIILIVFVGLFMKWFFFPEVLEVTGKVRPVNELEIKTLTNGILKEVRVQDAQRVNKGDILFEFENETLSMGLLKAVQQKETAQQEIKRLEELTKHSGKEVEGSEVFYKKEVIGRLKLEEIKLEHSKNEGLLAGEKRQLEEASLKVNAFQNEIDRLIIKAPSDGIFLGDLFSKKKTYFKKAEPLGNFFEPTKFYLDAVVPEIKTMNVQIGDPAQIIFKAFSGKYKGKVIQIDQLTREEIEKVFKVKYVVRIGILFEDFPDGLRPGMRGTARIYPNLERSKRYE